MGAGELAGFRKRDGMFRAGNHSCARGHGGAARVSFGAHHTDRLGGGADKNQPTIRASGRERGILT